MKHTLALLIVPALLTGCLDRDEEIVVHADGSADVTLTYSGDSRDFDATLFFPDWEVAKGKDGDRVVWKATKRFRDLNDYPAGFAPADLPHRERYFRYETRLKTRKIDGGTLYEFERTYPRIDGGEYHAIDHELFQRRETDRLLRKLHDGGMKNLTEGEQTRLYELVAEAEHAKRMTLAVRALGGISWHRRPDLIRKIADLYQQMLSATEVRRMFERLFQLPESERDASAEGFYAELRRRTIAAVGDSAYGSAYDAEEATYRAATAISDDRIRLTLRLPGEIVAGNATVENGVAKWDFDAKDLYKGDVTLRAVSIRP